MAFCSPSTKLLAVVHVGSLTGVVRRENYPRNQPILFKYELHGVALDVCRQIVMQTSAVTEPHIKVTKDAVDDAGVWKSVTLVPDSFCTVVSNDEVFPFS